MRTFSLIDLTSIILSEWVKLFQITLFSHDKMKHINIMKKINYPHQVENEEVIVRESVRRDVSEFREFTMLQESSELRLRVKSSMITESRSRME